MAITSEQIKKLREITWIGMMECKKALEEADWDMDAAIEVLRKKGLSKAAKKADRETFEGGIKIAVEWNKAYVVSVSCETDFLANSDKFKAMLDKVVEFLKEHWADSKSDAQEFINKNYALEMWENLQISNYEIIEGDLVASYVHSNSKLAALIVAKAGTDAEKDKQVAMHVTAASPEYLSPDEIPNDTIEREKSIQLEIMKNDPKMWNKTDDVLLKIIEGKIWKFKSEISLLEQEFVMDPSVKVKNFIWEGNIVSFKRYSI